MIFYDYSNDSMREATQEDLDFIQAVLQLHGARLELMRLTVATRPVHTKEEADAVRKLYVDAASVFKG